MKILTSLVIKLIILVLILFPSIGICQDIDENSYLLNDLSFDELNAMEVLANRARNLYWEGRYQEALNIFENISNLKHPSTPLYYNEIASCYMSLDDYGNAEEKLRDVHRFFQVYNTADLEHKALSRFGKESEKIYMGDPYERATNYLLLALIYMDRGDYDNALAACKSGLLADSDAKENQFESDFVLLHLLEGKIHQLRGDDDYAQHCFTLAEDSYKNTHLSIRKFYSDRQDWLDILQMSKKEKKKFKIKETNDEIEWKIEEIEKNILNARQKIQVGKDLNILLSGNYNTLIIVPMGKGPEKYRRGKDAAYVAFKIKPTEYQPVEVFLDNAALRQSPYTNVADINYQATTRGGRRMDAILKGKEIFRGRTVGTGEIITGIGNSVGGMVGLALALAGGAIQGIGGAMTPEADTRSWQLLPAYYSVYAIDLPPGEHEIIFTQRIYFEKRNERLKKITINGPQDIAVVLAPPAIGNAYSEFLNSGKSRKKRRKRNISTEYDNSIPLLIPPPLGFRNIEKFPSISERERPKAFSPDARKIIKVVKERFAGSKINIKKISHAEVISNFNKLTSDFLLALQIEFVGLDLKYSGKDKVYSSEFNFALVDTKSGLAKIKRNITGIYIKTRKDKTGTTDAFYKSFDNALEKFITGSDNTIYSLIVNKPSLKPALDPI